MKLEMLIFIEVIPKLWVYCVEYYLEIIDLVDAEKVKVVVVSFVQH